jgi:hypothetical protein
VSPRTAAACSGDRRSPSVDAVFCSLPGSPVTLGTASSQLAGDVAEASAQLRGYWIHQHGGGGGSRATHVSGRGERRAAPRRRRDITGMDYLQTTP